MINNSNNDLSRSGAWNTAEAAELQAVEGGVAGRDWCSTGIYLPVTIKLILETLEPTNG